MAYLIGQLAAPLLLMLLIGAIGGWFLHVLLRGARDAALLAERDAWAARWQSLGATAPPPPVAAPVLEENDAAARVRELEEENADLRDALDLAQDPANPDEGARDVQRLRLLEADNERLREEIDTLRGRLAAQDAAPVAVSAVGAEESSASRWRLRYLDARVKYLEGRLLAVETPPIDNARIEGLESDLVAARTALRDLEQTRARELAELRQTLADERNRGKWQTRYLEARVRYLEAQTAAAPAPSAAELEAAAREKWRARYHEERVKFLETQERQAILAVDAARDDEIAQLKTRLAALEGELETAKKDAADGDFLREMIATLEADVKAARAEAEDAETKRKALEAELAGLKAHPQLDESELTRARWKGRYLESRVRYLEDRLLGAPVRPMRAEPEPIELYASPAARVLTAPPPPAPVRRERVVWRQVRIVEEVEPEPEPAPPPPPPPAAAPRYVWRQVRVLDEPEAEPAPPPPPPLPATNRERTVWARILVTQDAAEDERASAYAEPRPYRATGAAPVERRPPGLAAPRGGVPDDLRMIGGVGPKIERTLHDLGIFHFDQVARWTEGEIAWVDQYLAFRGRIARERWVEQARALARGEDTEAKRRYLEGDHV